MGTDRRVIAVARVDHGVIAVDPEQLPGHVVEQFLEGARLPGLADTAREQAVTVDHTTLTCGGIGNLAHFAVGDVLSRLKNCDDQSGQRGVFIAETSPTNACQAHCPPGACSEVNGPPGPA